MTDIPTVQAAIVTTLGSLVSPITVLAHGGEITAEDLPILLAKVPCVLIGAAGITGYRPQSDSEWLATVRWVAYCIGADRSGAVSADQAANAASDVMGQLAGQRWGLSETEIRQADIASVRADNLFAGKVNILRVGLWAVTWDQPIVFA